MLINIGKKDFLYLFGKRIKHLRTNQNLIFRQLAQNCNIDHSDISKIEKGKKNIQLTTILELAKGLGLHPRELFDFEIKIETE
jgi:transcriptional regulator with XRE-family HTH domain